MELLRGKLEKRRGEVTHWMKQLEDDYIGRTGVKLFPDTLKLPEHLVTKIIGVHKEKGEKWVDSFPELVHYVEQKWELEILEPYNLSYNFVAPARTKDGNLVVVKMTVPNKEVEREADWLRYLSNGKCASLLDSDVETGILILEHLIPGEPLCSVKSDNQAIHIAAKLMKSIWQQEPKLHSFQNIEDWAAGLHRLKLADYEYVGEITEELIHQAKIQFSELVNTISDPLLLHGDLHQENILSTNNGWSAIDPKGLIGEAEIEVIAFLRNYLWNKPNPKETLKNRVDRFSQLLVLNKDRLIRWGFCLSVISACWSLEDGTDDIDDNIKVAEIFLELSEEIK